MKSLTNTVDMKMNLQLSLRTWKTMSRSIVHLWQITKFFLDLERQKPVNNLIKKTIADDQEITSKSKLNN